MSTKLRVRVVRVRVQFMENASRHMQVYPRVYSHFFYSYLQNRYSCSFTRNRDCNSNQNPYIYYIHVINPYIGAGTLDCVNDILIQPGQFGQCVYRREQNMTELKSKRSRRSFHMPDGEMRIEYTTDVLDLKFLENDEREIPDSRSRNNLPFIGT